MAPNLPPMPSVSEANAQLRNGMIDGRLDSQGGTKEVASINGCRQLQHLPSFNSAARAVSKLKGNIPGRNLRRDARREEEEFHLCFKVMDEDGDGILSVEELHAAYQDAGADVSIETISSLVKALRKSQAKKREQTLSASGIVNKGNDDDADYEDNDLTYKDFKDLVKLRTKIDWGDKGSGRKLASISDLPIPLGLVAFSQRRKIILRNYLMADFEIPDRFLNDVDHNRMRANSQDNPTEESGNIENKRQSRLSQVDDETLERRVLSMLPPGLQKKATSELSSIVENTKQKEDRLPTFWQKGKQKNPTGATGSRRSTDVPLMCALRSGDLLPSRDGKLSSADGIRQQPAGEGPNVFRREFPSAQAAGRHLGSSVVKVDPASPVLPSANAASPSRHRRWVYASLPKTRNRNLYHHHNNSSSGSRAGRYRRSSQPPLLNDFFSSSLVHGGALLPDFGPMGPSPAMLLSSAPHHITGSYESRCPRSLSRTSSSSSSKSPSRKQQIQLVHDAAKSQNGKAIMKGFRSRSLSTR